MVFLKAESDFIISTMRTGGERRHYLATTKVSEFLVVESSLPRSVQTHIPRADE